MLRERREAPREEPAATWDQPGQDPTEFIDDFEDPSADVALVQSARPDRSTELILSAERAEADHISDLLQQAMAAKGLAAPRQFSPELRDGLRQSRMLAGLLHSRMVTPLHLFAILSSGNAGRGARLASMIAAEPEWVSAGTLVRVALLRVAQQPSAQIATPSSDLMRWIGAASDYLARQNANTPNLELDDLISVLHCPLADPRVKQRIKELLREAANLGREPSEYVLTRHDVESAHRTVRYFRSETREALQEVQTGLGTLGSEVKVLTGAITTRPEEPTSQIAALSASSMVGELFALGGFIRNDLVQLEERQAFRMGSTCKSMHDVVTATTADQNEKLKGIEQRTLAIEQKLPAPPTGRWLAVAIAAVLLIGGLVGLLLSTGGR